MTCVGDGCFDGTMQGGMHDNGVCPSLSHTHAQRSQSDEPRETEGGGDRDRDGFKVQGSGLTVQGV
jgi:hypothetical protein